MIKFYRFYVTLQWNCSKLCALFTEHYNRAHHEYTLRPFCSFEIRAYSWGHTCMHTNRFSSWLPHSPLPITSHLTPHHNKELYLCLSICELPVSTLASETRVDMNNESAFRMHELEVEVHTLDTVRWILKYWRLYLYTWSACNRWIN